MVELKFTPVIALVITLAMQKVITMTNKTMEHLTAFINTVAKIAMKVTPEGVALGGAVKWRAR